MIGKQRIRTGSFSMLHATVLMLALGLAAVINPTSTYSTQITSAALGQKAHDGPVMIFKATVYKVFDCDSAKTGLDV
ncbi:hypothetical protein MWU54_01440 [Marivita sp. S6314]|uniref:hypothetical protein n=1 Tax=Marivita sp. S6314 TaxID=2926406 RepID=UPI001FF30B07|nr:hypothetical protein [Marivita sp. S6314]MCK0148673.1 hypothetical protein [Marivita sp. S6314]